MLESLSEAMTPTKFILLTAGSALGWLIAWGIRAWWRSWISKKCRGGHRKKYVELNLYTNWDCPESFHRRHTEYGDWWATAARWICMEDGCAAQGTDCLGAEKVFWKIEHGQVVPDKKKMESPPTDLLHPHEHMRRKRAKEANVAPALTFDDVYKAAEQAILKNIANAAKQTDPDSEKKVDGKGESNAAG